MILGYTISVEDGDLGFYEDAPADWFCQQCKGILDTSYNPVSLKLTRKARVNDIFSTDDGKTLVSERAAHFFKLNFADTCNLTRVNADTVLFVLDSTSVVPFDAYRRETKFAERCEVCGLYKGVYGATPAFLKLTDPLPHGLYKTDIEFGSSSCRDSLLIFGAADKVLVSSFKFHGSGIHLEAIES